MKERKYKNDWRSEFRIDPVTGRETQEMIYVGKWYVAENAAACRRALHWACAANLLFFVLLLVYFLLDFPGATTLYVFVPAAIALFPWLYWLMGCSAALHAPDRLTRIQRETGIGRVLRSAVGCAVFSGLAVLGDCVFLFLGGAARGELPGFPLLLAAAAVALFAALRTRGVFLAMIEEDNA